MDRPKSECFSEDEAVAFAENALGDEAASAVVGHAEACDGCRRLLSELARDKSEQPSGNESIERGALIGRYMVLELIGTGAMGDVFTAYDPELDRRLALKLLKVELDDLDEARRRIKAEAKLIARLTHPNVITVTTSACTANNSSSRSS
jgi:hypothetical protein